MTEHKHTKNCSCTGCQDADQASRNTILDIVDHILGHGKKSLKKKNDILNRKKDVFKEEMLKDAGVGV